MSNYKNIFYNYRIKNTKTFPDDNCLRFRSAPTPQSYWDSLYCKVLNANINIGVARNAIRNDIFKNFVVISPNSFLGSSLAQEKNPGWVWSRGTHILSVNEEDNNNNNNNNNKLDQAQHRQDFRDTTV